MPANLEKTLGKVKKQNSGVVISLDIPENPTGTNVFMGLGMLSGGEISSGLGLSSLPMFLMIAQILEKLPNSRAEILIADTHTLENTINKNKAEVTDVADLIVYFSQAILGMLGTSSNNVFKASNNSMFQTGGSGYSNRLNHDVLTAHTQLDCGVKIGWESKRSGLFGKTNISVRDEKFFDKQALETHPNKLQGLSFLRTFEGLKSETLSGGQNGNMPPYFGTKNMLLGEKIDIKRLAGTSKQMSNHMNKIEQSLKLTLGIRMKTKNLLQEFVDNLK